MKFLQLLGKELNKWPQGISAITQNISTSVWGFSSDKALPICNERGFWYSPAGVDLGMCEIGIYDVALSSDHATAIVTRADWKAERAKLKATKANGNGWIRHRGGKCPVEARCCVEVRYRDGRKLVLAEAIYNRWDNQGYTGDIMAYRIHKPAEQLAPVSEEAIQVGIDAADAGKLTPIAEVKARILSRKTARAMKDAEEGNLAKFGSIDELMQDLGEPAPRPLEWRNRIYELDTQHAEVESDYQRQISEITQERESLVQKLAGKGLALVEAVRPGEEILDWTDWKIGDVLTSTADGGGYTSGKTYKFLGMTAWGTARTLDDDGKESGMMPFCFAWHSRPAS